MTVGVPNVPGVPALSSYSANSTVLLLADTVAAILSASSAPQWGVYLFGEPVIESDSTISFEFKRDNPVSTYPVEEGAFQSYDKVQLPADIRIRVSAGGSVTNRQNFLESIEEVMNTTDLYDVVTPEKVFLGYNFVHEDFRRTATEGLGLISVDLMMTEIRESATATFTSTQQPSEAGQQNTGSVQPQTPSSSVQQSFKEGDYTVN